MLYRYQCLYSKDVLGGEGEVGDPYFFLHILSSCAEIRLHAKNQHPGVSGSALKVSVVVVVGWVPPDYVVIPTSYWVEVGL